MTFHPVITCHGKPIYMCVHIGDIFLVLSEWRWKKSMSEIFEYSEINTCVSKSGMYDALLER